VDQHAWQPPFGHYDARYAGFEPYDKKTPTKKDESPESRA
jgi:hypothetical protein